MLKDMLKKVKDMLERKRIYVVLMLAVLSIAATLMLHFLPKDESVLPKEPEPRTQQPRQIVLPPALSTELPPPKEPEPRAEQPSQTVLPPAPSTELPPPKELESRTQQPRQISPSAPPTELPPRKEPEPRAEQPSQTVETRIEGIAPTKKPPPTKQQGQTASTTANKIAPPKPKTPAKQQEQTVATTVNKIAPPKPKTPTKQQEQTASTTANKIAPPKPKTPAKQQEQTVAKPINKIAPPKPKTSTKQQGQTVSTPITELPPSGRMVLIPAGEFQMGSTYLTNKESQPVHTVYLDAFYIDTHEVTVGEYKQFLKAQGKQRLSPIAKKYAPTDKHPIVDVSWHDAMAYAQWAGKRLPTEAEWEKAARGPEQFEHYPWEGEDIGSSQANYNGTWGEILPVGRFQPNGYGLYDIAGNVFEWCLDPFFNDFYENSPKKNPFAGFQFKTRNETVADFKSMKGQRVIRGGTWKSEPLNVRVDIRNKADGTKGYTNVGFRCAKDVQ